MLCAVAEHRAALAGCWQQLQLHASLKVAPAATAQVTSTQLHWDLFSRFYHQRKEYALYLFCIKHTLRHFLFFFTAISEIALYYISAPGARLNFLDSCSFKP